MLSWLKLFRIKHWVKNLLVFAPAFFGGEILKKGIFISSLSAFISFCLCSSGLYIINDIFDLKYDRLHPKKRSRPLASGKIKLRSALIIAIILLILGLTTSYKVGLSFLIVLFLYICLNLSYSFKFKKITPLDVFCVSIGYLLRIIAGGKATNIAVSPWLFISAFLLALFITFGKRLGEIRMLKVNAANCRPALNQYNGDYLNLSLVLAGASALVTYALYTVEKGGHLIYTLIPAAYGIFRYLQLILKGKSGEPLEVFLHDIQLWVTSLVFLIGIGWVVYKP